MSMPDPVIRPADARDAPAMARLIGQLEFGASAADVAERLAAMQAEGAIVLVAELDGTVVGCLTTSIMRVLHRPALVGRISMIVVADGLRSRGIGALLVHAAEAALAAQGCYMVEVTSNDRRADAHRFYERLGYRRTSARFMRDL